MTEEKAETYRIKNGTNITVGDWVGIVIDQSGPNVMITLPDGKFGVVDPQPHRQGGRAVTEAPKPTIRKVIVTVPS